VVWLGQVSYSLYLVHAPVLVATMFALRGTLPLWASLTIGMVASLAAAEAFHRLVEAPTRDLARWAERRLRRPNHPRAAAPEAAAAAAAAARERVWAGEGGLFLDPHGQR
jgi:peptidoglycan/LPS O-acetylase OafA/YrhL